MANKKRDAAIDLRQAEEKYLLACGWQHALTVTGKSVWKAPKFKGVRYWDGVFPGDLLLHDRAIGTQKSYDRES